MERDGPFGAVRSCPLQQRPHPSNLREGKAQGRTCPRRERRTPTWADRRREHRSEKTQKPNRSILDRPTHRAPDSWSFPFSGGACTAVAQRRKRQDAQIFQPGRPIARLKHRDRSFDQRHVGPGARKRGRPPVSGIKPAKGQSGKPHERRRAKGVESDTVTRVTTGRPRCRPSSRDGNPSKLRDAEKGPDQAT